MDNPLITTIIPTFRRPKLLLRAIRSVLYQTYPNFQVCVYDNDSGDETQDVVADISKVDSRVKYFCHPENIGAVNNFNFGLAAVNTPFFSFLSDDDILLPEFFQTAMAGLTAFPDAAFSGAATIKMKDDKSILGASQWESDGYYLPPDGLLSMIRNNYLVWTSVVFRTELVANVGPLDTRVGGPCDIDFLLRIAARYPFCISRTPSSIFLFHDSSTTASAEENFTWSDWQNVQLPNWMSIIGNVKNDKLVPDGARSDAEKLLKDQLTRRLFSYGIRLVREKNYEDAYKAAESLRIQHDEVKMANVVISIAKCCRIFPPAYDIFTFLDRLRKTLRRDLSNSASDLRRRFGTYGRFVE